MKSVSKHLRVLVVGIALAVCSPNVLGQIKARALSKNQAATTLTILSPTGGADFSGYEDHLLSSIDRRWIHEMPESFYMGDMGIVQVRVQVRADGTFVHADPIVEKSSGKGALDAAAVATVRSSAPSPHFPSGFDGATIDLKISFFYNIPVKPYPVLEPAKPDAGGQPPK
jgi:TonB family protein